MRLSLKVVFKNLPGIKCVKVSPSKPECLVIHNLSAGSPSLLLSTRCKHRNVKTVHSTLHSTSYFLCFSFGGQLQFCFQFLFASNLLYLLLSTKACVNFYPSSLRFSFCCVSWFAICIVSFIGVSDAGLKIDSGLTGNINLKYKL